MKKILLLILASYLLMNNNIYSQVGETGLAFLKNGVSGRALGMGEAYTSIAIDPAATYYNPAALSLSTTPKLLLMHQSWIEDMKTEFLSATVPLNSFSLGFSLNSTSISNLQLRTQPGPQQGSFNVQYVSIGLSAAYQIDPLVSLGVTTKFLYEKIFIEDASGYAFDLGGLYKTPWDFNLALTVSNLGSMNSLLRESTKLPTNIRVGVGYEMPAEYFNGKLTLTSDLVSYTRENKTHLHIGAEYIYKNLFSIRTGYQTGYDAKNFTSGIGIHYKFLQFDYAYIPFRYDFGSTHTLSLGFEF